MPQNKNKSGAMEKLHILDECMLPLVTMKKEIKSLFMCIYLRDSIQTYFIMDFRTNNITLNLFIHIAYDI